MIVFGLIGAITGFYIDVYKRQAVGVVGLEAVAVTLISVYVYTIITNKVVIGFNQRKVAFIITYRTDDVCECIICLLYTSRCV